VIVADVLRHTLRSEYSTGGPSGPPVFCARCVAVGEPMGLPSLKPSHGYRDAGL